MIFYELIHEPWNSTKLIPKASYTLLIRYTYRHNKCRKCADNGSTVFSNVKVQLVYSEYKHSHNNATIPNDVPIIA